MSETLGFRYDDSEEVIVSHVSALAINPDGKIPLALQAANDHWSLPKGAVEDDEEVIDALYREFTEETGIAPTRLEAVRKIGVYARYSYGRDVTHNIEYYSGQTFARGNLQPRGRDIISGRWFTPEEAMDELQNTVDLHVLEQEAEELLRRARAMRAE